VTGEQTRSKSEPLGWWVAGVLLALGVGLVLTNPHFTFLDDETSIVWGAAQPAARILGYFLHGTGFHEHPPLYDLLLHGWLRLAGEEIWSLRLPSIAFYLTGIWVLAQAAARLAGARAGRALVWIAVLWPYGFHYGRLAAWYSLCFLLVSLLTLAYLRILESPSRGNWISLGLCSLVLVWANYFGWAILACLGADYLVRCRQDRRLTLRPWAAIAALLTISYLPLARAFWHELAAHTPSGHDWLARGLYGIYGLYTLAVSESVAPWFWWLGIPAALATAALLLILVATPQPGRRFLVSFAALFALMTALGILTTKRLMLIAPWLLLPAAMLAAGASLSGAETRLSPRRRRAGTLLAVCLATVFAIGWFGVFSRRHYAAPRFLEPWPAVARQAAAQLDHGAIVLGRNPSFLFYLSYAIASGERHGPRPLEALPHPNVYSPEDWISAGRPLKPVMNLVIGVPVYGPSDPLRGAEAWLDSHCRLESDNRELRDSGYAFKQRFFPQLGEPEWRVETRRYACPVPSKAAGQEH
jgi:4-amino-4-deoxy-L-arabinose transferase-like glycosyltransferase